MFQQRLWFFTKKLTLVNFSILKDFSIVTNTGVIDLLCHTPSFVIPNLVARLLSLETGTSNLHPSGVSKIYKE